MPDETLHTKLDELLAAYVMAEENGEAVNPNRLWEQHPEFREELQRYFADRERFRRLAAPLGAATWQREDLPATLRYFGDYELLEPIAQGGMGVVYKARQTSLNRIVAVKMILAGHLATEEDVKRFKDEAQTAASLKHKAIVPIHEVGQYQGQHYFSMDLIEGRNLASLIQTELPSPREAAEIVQAIADAVGYAHRQGIVHRDIKPSNVLLDASGQVHVTDFGLALHVAESGDLTRTGQLLGTPSYMAPEQARGSRQQIGPPSDVYALGVVLYELLVGRPPFRTESAVLTIQQVIHQEPLALRVLNPKLPADLETICLKCLEKDPSRRYPTAETLAADLNRYLRGDPIQARPLRRSERVVRWCRRNPAVTAVSALILLLLAVVALAYFREAGLRRDIQTAFGRLQSEQQRNSKLQGDVSVLEASVADLSERRDRLKDSLDLGERQLEVGRQELTQTYFKLARTAWEEGEVELADYYLEQCPLHLRDSSWKELKHKCRPQVDTISGSRCVAVNPLGTLLAAGGDDHAVNVWDVETGRLTLVLRGHDEPVAAVDFSPDGKLLASAGGRVVILWNPTSGEQLATLTSHTQPVVDLDFGPGQRLASASYLSGPDGPRGEVVLWDVHTFEALHTLPAMRYAVMNHDGTRLVTTVAGRNPGNQRGWWTSFAIWDLTRPHESTLRTIGEVGESLGGPIKMDGDVTCRPAFHPTRNEIAISKVHSIEFWDVDAKRMTERFVGDVQVGCLAYNADGRRLAYTGTTNQDSLHPHTFRTVVWNLITGEKERVLPWYSSAVRGAAFSPDGRRLITADGASIKLWDVTPPPDPTQIILDDIRELDVGPLDWPQWGGSRARINTPAGRDLPSDWDVGKGVPRSADAGIGVRPAPLVPQGSRNIKWAVPLGTQTYGNPVVANGKIFLGTNNGAGYLARYPREVDLGVLLCFDEATGEFLWQHSNEKLPTGRVHDWPLQGVCSTPIVDGDRLWYVSNRGEVVCLDTEGFRDGEDDGPVRNELVRMCTISFNTVLRDLLVREFEKRDIALPPHWSLRTVEDGRQDGKADGQQDARHWAVVEWFGYPANRLDWHFDVKTEADRLVVSRYRTKDGGKDVSDLFTIDWPLLAVLGQAEMLTEFRDFLEEAGIALVKDPQFETLADHRRWAFTARVRESLRRCELEWRNDKASVFVPLVDEPHEADVVWKFDMMAELGVSQHNMATCSMITADGLLFVSTSNGLDETHAKIPAPDAPSFLAMDRELGKVLWSDRSPGNNILHAQWASPSYGVFDGQPQVIFPGGDGWVYSFDPKGDGRGGSKLLWKFDANPKTSRWTLGGSGTRNNVIAFPAIYDGLVYIVTGQDPEHGEGTGHLWCIDPRKSTDGGDVSAELAVDHLGNLLPHRRVQAVDVSAGERALPNPNSAVVWHYLHQDRNYDGQVAFEESFHRSISIPVIKDDILYVADFSGLFHCLHAKTGKVYWTYDLLASCWSSALLVDGKVYICDEDGDVAIFRHSADPGRAVQVRTTRDGRTELVQRNSGSGELLNELSMGDSIYMTPIVANNVLYIATRSALYAIEAGHAEKPTER